MRVTDEQAKILGICSCNGFDHDETCPAWPVCIVGGASEDFCIHSLSADLLDARELLKEAEEALVSWEAMYAHIRSQASGYKILNEHTLEPINVGRMNESQAKGEDILFKLKEYTCSQK